MRRFRRCLPHTTGSGCELRFETHLDSLIPRTMKKYVSQVLAGIFILAAARVRAEVKVTVEYHDKDEASSSFTFKTVPPPSRNDAATSATFTVVDGEVDPNSGGVEKLNDGKLPEESDLPEENFFFNAGSPGGRIGVDLKTITDIRQVNTYSWHPNR